jgi:hypothetical protein
MNRCASESDELMRMDGDESMRMERNYESGGMGPRSALEREVTPEAARASLSAALPQPAMSHRSYTPGRRAVKHLALHRDNRKIFNELTS